VGERRTYDDRGATATCALDAVSCDELLRQPAESKGLVRIARIDPVPNSSGRSGGGSDNERMGPGVDEGRRTGPVTDA
jgi:hypothetical protein